MRLYHTATSPFVRKVMIAAHELGLVGRIEVVHLRPSPLLPDPTLSDANPLSKIPALVLEDGATLFDSRVIVEYLDSLADAPRLIPATGPARWDALRRQALADGILDAGILVFYERLQRPDAQQWQPWLDGQAAKVRQGLDALEALAPALGERVDAGTIAAAAALGWLDFRNPVGDFRDGRPALAAWYEGFSARPSMQATLPAA